MIDYLIFEQAKKNWIKKELHFYVIKFLLSGDFLNFFLNYLFILNLFIFKIRIINLTIFIPLTWRHACLAAYAHTTWHTRVCIYMFI